MTGLPGSSIADLADRVLGIALQRPAVDAIYQQTDGSPLFVIELLKVLQKEGATRAELIEPAGAGADGYRFTHALIREVLYDELPALERLKLHGRVGDALVDINRADLMPVLSRIAHHYYKAAPLGYSEQAVIFGLRAAERATQMCACEDAIAHYDRVLATLSLQAHESDVLWTAVPSRSLAGENPCLAPSGRQRRPGQGARRRGRGDGWQVLHLLEAGRPDELERLLSEYRQVSVARFGIHQYYVRCAKVTLALLRA